MARFYFLDLYSKSDKAKYIWRKFEEIFPVLSNSIKIKVIDKIKSINRNLTLNYVEISGTQLFDIQLYGLTRIVKLDQENATITIPYTKSFNSKNLNEYLLQEEILGTMDFIPEKKLMLISNKNADKELFGSWISLLDPSSNNWMHFISEILPNALEASFSSKEKNFGLIIDKSLTKSAQKLVKIIFPGKPILAISDNSSIRVECLILGSKFNKSGSLFWPRNGQKILGEYTFSNETLLRCRDTIFENFQLDANKAVDFKKIYVKRKSFFRRIVNDEAIEEYLKNLGFLVFEPNENNLEQQILLFSTAEIVVGQAGASLANIMFMQPNSKVYSLMADSDWINYKYFADYASIFQVSFIPVLGNIVEYEKLSETNVGMVSHPTNASFSIDIAKIKQVVQI
jgi:hypothetical protein